MRGCGGASSGCVGVWLSPRYIWDDIRGWGADFGVFPGEKQQGESVRGLAASRVGAGGQRGPCVPGLIGEEAAVGDSGQWGHFGRTHVSSVWAPRI